MHVLVPVVKFFDKPLNLPENYLFESVRFGRPSKLHIMANGDGVSGKPLTTDNAFVFDTDTDTTSVSGLQHFSPSKAAKPNSTIISAYSMLYYFAHPSCYPCIPDPSFERYDSVTNSWQSLPSCPYKTLPKPSMEVVGYAVCYGYILISSMYKPLRDYAVMAFHIGSQTWHQVKVPKSKYYPFKGRAVVVDGIIYSLSFSPHQVLAFPFWRDSDDTCFLGTPLPLQVRKTSKPPSPMTGRITQNLVHLGGLDFCLIVTGRNEYSIEHQYLCMTTFRILGEGGGAEMRTLRSSVFQVDLMSSGYFRVNFGFTSVCEDVEPEEDCCPTAPVTSIVETTRMTSEDKDKKKKKTDRRLYVVTGRQQDFLG